MGHTGNDNAREPEHRLTLSRTAEGGQLVHCHRSSRLPIGLGERIDALVGRKRRAAFIREVVEREVERLENHRAGHRQER